jgi:predicted nicotinamide N-methyase
MFNVVAAGAGAECSSMSVRSMHAEPLLNMSNRHATTLCEKFCVKRRAQQGSQPCRCSNAYQQVCLCFSSLLLLLLLLLFWCFQGLDRAQTQAADQITVQLNDSSNITIKQNPTALKGAKIRVGAAVWDGAYVLASYLNAQPQGTFQGLRCVELGCGCGLLGLLLARLGASAVYLTDKSQYLVGPRVNAAKNKLLAPAAQVGAQQQQQLQQQAREQQQQQPAVVQVVGLDWEDQQAMAEAVAAIRAQGQIDLIVASDCIYPGG